LAFQVVASLKDPEAGVMSILIQQSRGDADGPVLHVYPAPLL
jgi:hypothetical protein